LLDALAYSDEIHKRLLAGPEMDSHWYLWALGVSPASQGRGIGGKLLRPVLSRSDRAGVLCYLETVNERNVAFYQRWGFEVRNEEVVPGVEVKVWSMIREPGG
jgi:ribosomal protein S18 acetylase RimI-like enzyme